MNKCGIAFLICIAIVAVVLMYKYVKIFIRDKTGKQKEDSLGASHLEQEDTMKGSL